MPGIAIQTKKYAILFHRWLGVAFCLLFLMWFASGIVMMYASYPEVTEGAKLLHAKALEAPSIRLTPAEAAAKAEIDTGAGLSSVSLTMRGDRPVYSFFYGRERVDAYADTGELTELITVAEGASLADAWVTGWAASDGPHYEGRLKQADQWTLSPAAGAPRPWLKYSYLGGDEIYISEATGAVAQHTTRWSRTAAYFGAIPHWLYFLPLRRNGQLWNDVVVWSSGVGTIMSLLGIVIGLWLYSPSKRYRFPGGVRSVPYAGQKRWHTILGLFFGLTVCTWAFSGMMSMEPFDLSGGRRAPRVPGSLMDKLPALADFGAQHPRKVIERMAGTIVVKQLELGSFAGEPVYTATEAPNQTMIVPLKGPARDKFGTAQIEQKLLRLTGGQTFAERRVVSEFEAYYVDRHGERPLPVLFYRLNDDIGSSFYVDPKTARVVGRVVAGSRLNRWLYHGLHSMDLPILYKYRPLWDIVVLTLMLGGTALCVTSLVIAWRRLKRKIAQLSS